MTDFMLSQVECRRGASAIDARVALLRLTSARVGGQLRLPWGQCAGHHEAIHCCEAANRLAPLGAD